MANDAKDEIEITPAMIEAGVAVFFLSSEEDRLASPDVLVSEIFQEMALVDPRYGVEG